MNLLFGLILVAQCNTENNFCKIDDHILEAPNASDEKFHDISHNQMIFLLLL